MARQGGRRASVIDIVSVRRGKNLPALRSCSHLNEDIYDGMNDDGMNDEKRFHGWRLLGALLAIIVVIATASFVVDWLVIGPLEGRVF